MEPPTPVRLRLSTVLSHVVEANRERPPTLGELVDAGRHAGFGLVVALLALLALPLPGLGLPFGVGIALAGAQMAAGRDRPWLPRRVRRHVLSRRALERTSKRLTRWSAWLERVARPRQVWLTRGPMWRAIGLALVFLGVGLALPIPIPGSNAIFIVPILGYAIGLLEDDGGFILGAHFASAALAGTGVAFSAVIAGWIQRLLA